MTTARAAGASPTMAQWFLLKAEQPDALLFFRMGDFFELFFEDAQAAAAALDIALTARGEHAGAPVPMCGVPVGTSEIYLARLIRRGFRVAVAEQMETASERSGRAPLRRAIVRLVTAGTLTEDALLESARPNLLLALAQGSAGPGLAGSGAAGFGAAWLDVSTGLFETEAVAPDGLPALLGRVEPSEVLAPAGVALGEWEALRAPACEPTQAAAARTRLAAAFGARSLDAFGSFSDLEAVAAMLALDYVRATQAGRLPRLSPPVPLGEVRHLALDAATRASLDILRARDGDGPSLFSAVSRTLSAPGARLLAQRLAAPLTDPGAIARRQDQWCWLLEAPSALAALRAALRGAPDMARALGRLSLGRGTARDLAAVRDGLGAAAAAGTALDAAGSHGVPGAGAEGLGLVGGAAGGALAAARRDLAGEPGRGAGPYADGAADPAPPRTDASEPDADADADGGGGTLEALRALLARALVEQPPVRDDGHAVAPGFDGELDAERALRDDSRRVIATLQLDYAQRYGVASLRIRHHAQLGYVVEAPAVAVEALRAHPELTLRQGMANGARFSSVELGELDRRITEAAERAGARERAVLARLVADVLARGEAIAAAAAALAGLDVAQSAARLAEGGRWCRPVVSADVAFRIEAGRHPVVEAALAGRVEGGAARTTRAARVADGSAGPLGTGPEADAAGGPAGSDMTGADMTGDGPAAGPADRADAAFQPNDCDLSPERRVLLLTGPNMAGKSTFLRQNALIVILAQAGLPVPADSARIGVVDRLFSRVGAADDLARGRSTFMVEMTETAAILHQAGPRSLVVVDEIGRGTATLDGLAIAWAVLEALHERCCCRTVFATHFHELAQLGPSRGGGSGPVAVGGVAGGRLARMRPHTMRVQEWRGGVVFLHEVAEGAAGRSWGVHVARLAGVPAVVVRRAGLLLSRLEAGERPREDLPLFAALDAPAEGAEQAGGASPEPAEATVVQALSGIDVDALSPREALEALYRLKGLCRATP